MAVIKGLRELDKKLSRLEKNTSRKILRQATAEALRPTLREIKAAAPVGKRDHKTYKGRTVFPGHLKRSVKMRTRGRYGWARAAIGVQREAFYGINFIALGRKAGSIKKGKRKGRVGKINPVRWFHDRFIGNRQQIENDFKKALQKRL